MTTLLFYSEENGLVIVCPPVDPDGEEVGETFWPVFHGGGFCGVSYSELRAAGKGTLAVDEHGRARIGT
ncbi:MAG TPA: hypothetical protein VFJ13_06535 [Paracoccaceae bacterium]|nr:hypothetical protein [Paracoccaceae bacterium]